MCPLRLVVPLSLTAALALGACSTPGGDAAPGPGEQTLVLASPQEPGQYHPLTGEGQYGVSLLYDGLLAMDSSGDDAPPDLVPALASAMPQVSDDGLTWTVTLRDDVTFSDGTALDAADVVATYEALMDPQTASTIASTYTMLSEVRAVDDRTVTFTLEHPYAEFGSRLLLAVGPSEAFTGGPASESSLNTTPIGTGAYTLTELGADRAVFTARDDHFRGRPAVDVIRHVTITDDNTRAQRMAAGEVDGTILPPALAAPFADRQGMTVVPVNSVDFRMISLPSSVAFTADPAARRAMNLAVERRAMVDSVLAGEGLPAFTPIPPQMGAAHSSQATIPFDRAAAEAMLDEAGWVKGPDGVRAKGGDRAEFPVLYNASDTVRRDLAVAFAADMEKIGVKVNLEGSTWDRIEPRLGDIGLVLGGGSHPTSPDSLSYDVLHRRTDATTSPYSNPGNFGTDALDTALEEARRAIDDDARAAAHRRAQETYVEEPGSVFLVFLRHVYVAKDEALPPDGTPLVVQPHMHDAGWGPWWNISTWQE